jgi:hypothetical protein
MISVKCSWLMQVLYSVSGNADDPYNAFSRSEPRLLCDVVHATWHMRSIDVFNLNNIV